MNRVFLATAALLLLIFTAVPAANAKCNDARPGGPPTLLSATEGQASVTLTWSEAPDPVTYYLLQYGPSKDSLIYGSPDIGGRGTTSYTVDSLTTGTKYYFQIRAGNGCKPGEFSNTLTAVPGGEPTDTVKKPGNLTIYKQVLGTTTATKEAEEKIDPIPQPAVMSADAEETCMLTCNGSLFLIAEAILLAVFFTLSRRYFKKPFLSLFVPLAINGAFYLAHKECNSYNFTCRYFLPLSVIIFIVILVIQKNILFQYHKNSK